MELTQDFHMNKGTGETSYAKNSTIQSKLIYITKPVIEVAILEILSTNFPESMGIADLGCSSGPNALLVVSEIMEVLYSKCRNLRRPTPELRVSLNDLYSNDFNDIFVSLPAFYNKMKEDKGTGMFGTCFISGVPGSFYGRLFPVKSLHFVHSSSGLHWLSQVPPGLDSKARIAINKRKIYISKTSPHCVLDSYSLQFQKDFSLFLKSRSEEIVPGGRMVLSFMGRRIMEPTTNEESCDHWELLGQALMTMVSEGLIKQEKVDSFNAPYYAPCAEELKLEVQKEGSFTIDRLEAFEIDWDGGIDVHNTLSSGQRVAKTIRAVVESMLESHFGRDIMDDLFRRYGEIVDDYFSKTRAKFLNLVISFVRKG